MTSGDSLQRNYGGIWRVVLLLAVVLVIPFRTDAQEPVVIKIATLAPKGTGYYQVLQDIATDWEAITEGAVVTRLYPSGVIGDEQDVIRKMRIDQIQAGAVSTKGLHMVDESVYGLNYPMMVQSWDELDWLRSRLVDYIEEKIRQKGFELLFWADVGWVYFFSTKPIQEPEDVKSLKLFTRATDFDDLQLWKQGGFNPVPLTTNDVLPGLQTGLINVVQAPAFLALSSQWFGVANHMLDLRWAALSGGFLISRRAWNRIPEQYRPILRQSAVEHSRVVQDQLRYQSDDAIDVMNEHGLIIHELTEQQRLDWQRETQAFYPRFKGVIVPEEMHEKVMDLWPKLRAYRAERQKTEEASN